MSGSPSELVFQELASFVYGDAPSCPGCSRVDKPDGAAASDDWSAPTFDVSATLDGAIIATEAFRAACVGVSGIDFVAVGGASGCWLVVVEQLVRVDPFASHIRHGPVCETCDRPRYVTRPGPLRLEADDELPLGFSATDVEFGDTADFGADQAVRLRPDILVDRATGRMLKTAGLLGIHLITQP